MRSHPNLIRLGLLLAITAAVPATAGVVSTFHTLGTTPNDPVIELMSSALGSRMARFGALLTSRHISGGTWPGIVLIVLSADASLPEGLIEEQLSVMYPFVDSRETLRDLARAMKNRFKEEGAYEKPVTVSFTEAEVRLILSTADLTEAEIRVIVDDLK